MQHPLLFADKFMDLVAGYQVNLTHEDIVFLNELNIGKYITDRKLSKKYFSKQPPVVEDTAFMVKYLSETIDVDSIGNFIHFVIGNYTRNQAGEDEQEVVAQVFSKLQN